MHKKTIPYYLLPLVIILSLFSCVPQQKVGGKKDELKTADSTLIKQQASLAALDRQLKQKQAQNEKDDTTSARIHQYITRTNAEIDKMHEQNTIVIGETVVDRDDWVRLTKALSASRKSSKQIGDKIVMLSDLINQNTVIRIDQDVLFEPGKYTMTPEMASTIGRLFEPAATEIDRFMDKYPKFPLSLVITAKGYADGTTIAEGSLLYDELKQMMRLSGSNPDNKALNKELSNARAKEVITLFKKFAAERAKNKSYLKNVLYIHEGKGEVLPNPKITDYKVEDSRRRVVYLFWSVFPE